MRIGVVTPLFPPSTGGLETAVSAQVAALVADGHSVEVFTQTGGRSATGSRIEGGVLVRRYRNVTGSARYPVAPSLFSAVRSAFSPHAVDRFDVMHVHAYHGAAALAALAVGSSVPVVFTPHFHGGGHTAAARFMHVFHRPLGRRLFDRSDRIVCVSQAEASLVEQHFPHAAGKTTVIHNGLDLRVTPVVPPLARERPLVLCLGRMEHYKRVDLVLRALAHMPGFELAIVGDGPALTDLRGLARGLELADRVHFPGRVPDAELAGWLGRAWVFASMSEREAFGLTVLEAAAWGIPVVASPIPAHQELAQLVPSGVTLATEGIDASGLAGMLQQTAKPLARGTVQPWVETLTWARVSRALLDVYSDVAARSDTRPDDVPARLPSPT